MNKAKLQYFIGKICTIFTTPTNHNFQCENPEKYLQKIHMYFLGTIESIDESGILMSHINSNNKSFYFWPNIIGIAEEEVLNPEKTADADKIAELQSIAIPNIKQKEGPFIDPSLMLDLSKKLKSGISKDFDNNPS